MREFIDDPVKTYSSGMYMRLGFAVAIHVDPDVLLIDEVLAVGDEAFTRKCLDKIAEFRRRGRTILFVTHTLGLVEKMCDEALWLRHGRHVRPRRPQAGHRLVPHVRGRGRGGRACARATRRRSACRREDGGEAPALPAGSDEGPAAGYRAGPLGLARGRDPRRALRRRARARTPRVRPRRDRLPHPARPRRAAGRGLRVRPRALLRRGHERLRHEHRHRGLPPEARRGRRRGHPRPRGPEPRRGDVHASTSPPTVATGRPTTTTAGSTRCAIKSRTKDVGLYRPAHRWAFGGGVAIEAPAPRPELDLGEDGPA